MTAEPLNRLQIAWRTAQDVDTGMLVNLGLVHRDSEWQPYWEGWVEWMCNSGWRRFGWYVWDQGPGLPGDWNGRLAPSHEFIFHFNRQPRKPNKTVESKHAGETLGGGGLRGADGTVHRKTGFGNAIQSHRIPDSVFRIMRHKGGLGAAGSHPALDHHLLDFGNGFRRVQVLRADVGAVHDGVAAIEPERILEIVEPLAGRFVAGVGDPARRL